MNALDMAMSEMEIEEEISKSVAKFENGGYHPDHKKPPSRSFKEAMKTDLMMGIKKVTMNMDRPDSAANIQKRFDRKFTAAKKTEMRKSIAKAQEMADKEDPPFDVNSDESWKLQTKCP